jgi:hypothetical protein
MDKAASRVIVMEQDLIDSIENDPLFVKLFEQVLDMHPSDCLLTDLSSLSDFLPNGMPALANAKELTYSEHVALWDEYAIAKVTEIFGVTLKSTTLPLIQLHSLLKNAAQPILH